MVSAVSGLLIGRAIALSLAFAADLVFGDPPTPAHPVAWLGCLVAVTERSLRRRAASAGLLGGALLAGVVVSAAVGLSLSLSLLAWHASGVVGILVDAMLIWATLSARSLSQEGRAITDLLSRGDLPAARTRVARIVARRTDVLGATGVARAAVESLGENVVDGVVAPILWATFLGAPGAWLHKSASTLDSMVGYRSEPYGRFGTASARFDDVLAWLPARLALAIISVAAIIAGEDARGAWRIGLRDRRNHASPNSAHGEAAFAGALGIRLGGPVAYRDGLHKRPFIGDEDALAPDDKALKRAARLVIATAWVTIVLAATALLLVQMGVDPI